MRRALIAAVVFASASAGAQQREPPWAWAAASESGVGVAASALTDREADLQRACGVSEEGLHAIAERLVLRKKLGLPYLDLDGLTFAQRASGEPHV